MANIFNTTAIGGAMQPAASGSLLMKDQAEKKAVKEGTEQGKAEKQAGLENTKKVEEAKEARKKGSGRFDWSTSAPINPSKYIQSLYDNQYVSKSDAIKAAANNKIASMMKAGVSEDEAKQTVGVQWKQAEMLSNYHDKFNSIVEKEAEKLEKKGVNPTEAEAQAKEIATNRLKEEKDQIAIELGKEVYKPEIERLKALQKQKEDELQAWKDEHGWHGIFKAENTPEMNKEYDAFMNEINAIANKIESYKDKPWLGEMSHTEKYWDWLAAYSEEEKNNAFDTWQLAESDLRKWDKDNQYDENTATPELKAKRAEEAKKASAAKNVYNSYGDTSEKVKNREQLKKVQEEANSWWDNLKNKENLTDADIKKYDEYVNTINSLAAASGNPNRHPTYWQKYADDYSEKNRTEKLSLKGGHLVPNTHQAVANANVGDFIKTSRGELKVLTQEDIEYSQKKVSPQVTDEKEEVMEQVEENPEEKIDIDKITDGKLKSKAEAYNKVQTDIDNLKSQLEDPNLSEEDRIKIESDIETYEAARQGFISALGTTTEDIQSHVREREDYEKFITKTFQKGIIPAWITDTREFNKYIDSAEERLEIAKARHDSNGAKNALNQLNKLKEQKKAAHQEYGMFLLDALGTSLINAGQSFLGGTPNAQSLYSQKIARNILADTDRWNAYKTKTLEQLGADIDRRWAENSDVKQTYNELLHDAASAEIARQMGVLDKVNGVEAIAAMKRVLGTDLKETLSTMSLLGYKNEQIVFQTLAASDIDINELVATLEEFANQGLDFATNALQKLQGIRASFGE